MATTWYECVCVCVCDTYTPRRGIAVAYDMYTFNLCKSYNNTVCIYEMFFKIYTKMTAWIYICIQTCAYISICTAHWYVCMCVHRHIFVVICMHTCVSVSQRDFFFMNICVCTHTQIYVHMCKETVCTIVCIQLSYHSVWKCVYISCNFS